MAAADARVQALLDADDTTDLPLEYLRLLKERLPERFAALVASIDLRLPEDRKQALRERVLELGEER